jgi:Leucine-rich repeat (LRR) protein
MMSLKSILFLMLFIMLYSIGIAQTDSSQVIKEYNSIEEALKNPEKVYRLNLSNQKVQIPKEAWSRFVNLEFLSFKNDHLEEIPQEISLLKKLKVLDLSGNDFTTLPKSFSELYNLEELFLNDEKKFNLNANIDIISFLPRLKILHLENDSLLKLPKNIFKLNHLEKLFLNSNSFSEIPDELSPEILDKEKLNFGFKINF